MALYKLSNLAKEDLIRIIHQYGVEHFGETLAEKYFEPFFECFETIAQRPFSFESVDFIKKGYRPCVCGADSIYYKINDGVIEIKDIIGRPDIIGIIEG